MRGGKWLALIRPLNQLNISDDHFQWDIVELYPIILRCDNDCKETFFVSFKLSRSFVVCFFKIVWVCVCMCVIIGFAMFIDKEYSISVFFSYFFLSSLLVCWCLLSIFPGTRKFPFLQSDSFLIWQFYSFCCFSFPTFHYQHITLEKLICRG